MRNKNKVRLTESQLNRVIKESVKRVLREDAEYDAWNEHYGKILSKRCPKVFKKNGQLRKGNFEDQFNIFLYGTDQADKRPLHRKGSINRELMDMDKTIKESIRKVLRESMNTPKWMTDHNISPKEALAQFLRISPKKIDGNDYDHFFDAGKERWCVFGSYEEATEEARKQLPDYCEGAAPDDYWYNAGYEKTNNGDFDWEQIADDIIDSEGPEWYFSSYNGTSVDLPDNYIGFRWD